MAPRILICSASVGSGHGRAAQAVQRALTRLRPDAMIRHVDVLDFTNPIFRRIYGRGYFDAIALAPHIVRWFYDFLDRPSRFGFDKISSLLCKLNFRRFHRLLTDEPWDLVISTHFLPPEIIAGLRKAGRVSFPHAVVTTDFDVHRLWAHSPCEQYFTATEEGRVNLAGLGVPLQSIFATGIPIDPAFSEPKSIYECRRRHGIRGDHPVILQLSGGHGFGPAETIHRQLLDVRTPLEIVFVAGRNEPLRQAIEAIPCPARHRRVVTGYTDRMDEYMAAADLIVTKPGGLTSSESLARGAGMLIVEPIPGQEDRNCDFLLEQGSAQKVNNFASLSHKIESLLNDPDRLSTLRESAARAGKPMAAFDVARQVLSLIEPAPIAPTRLPANTHVSRFSPLRLRRWRRTRRGAVAS